MEVGVNMIGGHSGIAYKFEIENQNRVHASVRKLDFDKLRWKTEIENEEKFCDFQTFFEGVLKISKILFFSFQVYLPIYSRWNRSVAL